MPFRSPLRAILLGGLIVGALDGLDAIIFFGLRGVSTIRIFQAIAAGLEAVALERGTDGPIGYRCLVATPLV